MKKQTWSIILLLVVLILLSLFFGKINIYEGAEGVYDATVVPSSSGAPVAPETEGKISTVVSSQEDNKFPVIQEDKEETIKVKDFLSDDKDKKDSYNKHLIQDIKAKQFLITDIDNKINSTKIEHDNLLIKAVEDSYIPEVVYLPLSTDAINIAKDLSNYLDKPDPSNSTKEMNKDIYGKTTTLNYVTYNGIKCVRFTHDNSYDVKNYISFPFINPPKFSFSIWIYINPTHGAYYTVLSITNKKYLTPSVQLDVQSNNIMIFCNLPGISSRRALHQKRGCAQGWTYVTYTYDSEANSSMYINNRLISSSPSNGAFFRDTFQYKADYIFIGRSGDIDRFKNHRGYYGYLFGFTYYALVLEPKKIEEIHDYTLNRNKI